MVSYVVEQVSGQAAFPTTRRRSRRKRGRSHVTRSKPAIWCSSTPWVGRISHMGIYIGEGRFIHAPSSRGKVRLERLDNRYFASRFDGARTLLGNATQARLD